MSNTNALKGFSYDDPAYRARPIFASIMTAGSGGVSGKFIANASMYLNSLHAYTTIAGTSTYTQTQYFNTYAFDTTTGTSRVFPAGTATSQTVHANSTQLSIIRITNTATFGAAPALSTTTVGPFTVSVPYSNGTATGGIGAYAQFSLNTASGTAGIQGLPVSHGDQFYVVNGTDATHVALVQIEAEYLANAQVMS